MSKKWNIRILLVICSLFIARTFLPSALAYLNNPYDEYLMQQWGWLRIYADVAYANNYRGDNSTIVAVIDTGIDLDHPDLQANIYTNPGEIPGIPGVDDDGNGYIDDVHGWNFVGPNNNTEDNDGHGTHVSGIIAAIDNTIDICGVAPHIKILPIKVIETESGNLNLLTKAINYSVKMGAKIISMSIGTNTTFSDPQIDIAIKYAYLHNVTLVAAAGNDKSNKVSYPACNPYVIAVAATTSSDGHAFYSNTGPEINISAPGGDSSGGIISTYKNGGYISLAGTSMACPHVSSAIALMLQWNNSLTPAEIRARLIATAIDLGTPGRDDEFGAGLVNVAGILGLPMVHTYNPTLDWFLRNIWWIGLIGIAVILLIIFSALKKTPQGSSSSTPSYSSPGYF